MVNTIRPRQSLMAQSQGFLEKTKQLNAENKSAATGARAALGQSTVSVGSGENRQKARSSGASIKGILTSLSNALMAVLYSPVALVKALHAYTMRPSRAGSDPAPKKAMDQVARGLDNGAASVYSFLNSNPVTKENFRSLRGAIHPPTSTRDALAREADDALTDLKGQGKTLLRDLNKLFKD